eukprot:9470918-Pyramimonas_sp.AAC.1
MFDLSSSARGALAGQVELPVNYNNGMTSSMSTDTPSLSGCRPLRRRRMFFTPVFVDGTDLRPRPRTCPPLL